MKQIEQRNTRWDLRKMFPTDEDWKKTLAKVMENTEKLAAGKGRLADSAAALCRTAELYEAVERDLDDLMVFANSNFDQDMSDSEAKELFESAQNAATSIGEKLAFMAPELMGYSLEDFQAYCRERPELELYDRFARDFFERKEHVLSGEMESLLVKMNDLGESFSKVFDDLVINDISFPVIKAPDGTDLSACESNYYSAMSHEDRAFRSSYFHGLLDTYGAHINTLTSIYYGSVKNDVFTARSRRYPTARAMALAGNHIPEEVYDNLVETVRKNTGPLQDYVEMRREKLGLDQAHFYDLFVPIVRDTKRSYTYEEAQEIVLKATAILGEDYTQFLRRAFAERWIDVYPGKNKKTGAYSTGSYTSHPYVLLNFTGTLEDVFTLAHELGHSLHTWFSCHSQPFIYSGYSIFCAEVASTLNEQLVSHYLYEHARSEEERLLLLDKRLNDLRSTFYRQTMFADFENQTHQIVEKGEPLLPDVLCGLHRKLNRDYYGENFAVDKSLSFEWARIPHFYTAFYVYQYATGIAASTAIAKRILSMGQPAVEDYRRFLRGGSSLHPIELLKLAGVDMASEKPVLDTVEDFRKSLEELKKRI